MPDLLKIGHTTRSVSDRIAELNSATGVPRPFLVQASFESSDPPGHEAEVHRRLAANRLPNREFFRITVTKAISTARAVTGSVPRDVLDSRDAQSIPLLPPPKRLTSIYKKWWCRKCSRNFVSETGKCCDSQAKLVGPWKY